MSLSRIHEPPGSLKTPLRRVKETNNSVAILEITIEDDTHLPMLKIYKRSVMKKKM
jgi:hypothetical protein